VHVIEQLGLFAGEPEVFHGYDLKSAFLDLRQDVPDIAVPDSFRLDHCQGDISVHLYDLIDYNGCKNKILSP
jgi:hypothetical protein